MWCGLRTRLRAPESWRSHAKWRTAHANGNVTLTPHIPVPLGRRLGTKVCCRTLHHRQRDTYVSKANANYNPPRICAHAALTLRSLYLCGSKHFTRGTRASSGLSLLSVTIATRPNFIPTSHRASNFLLKEQPVFVHTFIAGLGCPCSSCCRISTLHVRRTCRTTSLIPLGFHLWFERRIKSRIR